MRHEYSCGAVIFTRAQGEPLYVVIRSLEGVYGFPKGHIEPGETERETALREIREEVGLTPRLIPGFKAEKQYPLPKSPDVMKHVIFFLGEYEDQSITPQAEELSWAGLMTYDEAISAFQHESNRETLKSARAFIESMQ